MRRLAKWVVALSAGLNQAAIADGYVMVEARAKYHYQMFCQGCHTPDGVGGQGVPRLKGHVGHFVKSQRGREYLIRVPGAAYSVLNDAQLAEVINWTIREFAADSEPESWKPYSGEEVGNYRRDPLLEVLEHRKTLLTELGLSSQ